MNQHSDLRTLINQATSDATSPETLVELESHPSPEVSNVARDAIIARVSIPAMYACAENALARRSDAERAEFWFVEVATAPPPASPQELVQGAIALCLRILFPQMRFNEAVIYLDNAARLNAGTDSLVAETMLTTTRWVLGEYPDAHAALLELKSSKPEIPQELIGVELQRVSALTQLSGTDVLIDAGAWMSIDLEQPGIAGMSRQSHYDRLLAFLVQRNGDSDRANFVLGIKNDYLPTIIGYLLGLAPSVAEVGADREIAARALYSWAQLVRQQGGATGSTSGAQQETSPKASSSTKTGVMGYGTRTKSMPSNTPDVSPDDPAPRRLGYGTGKGKS